MTRNIISPRHSEVAREIGEGKHDGRGECSKVHIVPSIGIRRLFLGGYEKLQRIEELSIMHLARALQINGRQGVRYCGITSSRLRMNLIYKQY